MVILFVIINVYFINGYWWLLMIILLMDIGGYWWVFNVILQLLVIIII
jgi:hypothetical protein